MFKYLAGAGLRRAAWLAAGVLASAVAHGERPDAAMVTSARGDTSLMRESMLSSPVRMSSAVRSGDRLMTGDDGRLELRFSDSAMVSIGPGSVFKIESYRFDGDDQKGFFALARGTIHTVSGAIGKRNQDDYRLTTPTAVLGIRGTEFSVEQVVCRNDNCAPGLKPGLAVAVIKGRVAVSNDAGTTEVPAGSTIYLKDRGAVAVFTAGGEPKAPPAPRRAGPRAPRAPPAAPGGPATPRLF